MGVTEGQSSHSRVFGLGVGSPGTREAEVDRYPWDEGSPPWLTRWKIPGSNNLILSLYRP